DGERKHAGAEPVHLDVVPRERGQGHRAAEIEQQDDDELGNAADDGGVDVREQAERAPAREFRSRPHEPDQNPKDQGDRGDQQRRLRALEELPAVAFQVEDGRPPLLPSAPSPSQRYAPGPSLSRFTGEGLAGPSPTKWERKGPMAKPWEGEGLSSSARAR